MTDIYPPESTAEIEPASSLGPAIQFVDVHRSFGRNPVLQGVNLSLPTGQVSVILGPSGTGKSVCLKHIVGLLRPSRGDVLVGGQSVPRMEEDELFAMRRRFGVLFQDGALFGSMNLYENVAFPLRQHTQLAREEIGQIVMDRLTEVGLAGAAARYPNELSGGMRKRAGLARALALSPEVVLFDEPDSGLDPVRTALLCRLIRDVHEHNGGTYVIITHDLATARSIADYIAVLWRGEVVEAGPAESVLNSTNPFVAQFTAGETVGPLAME
jgi:phospholipid/cholesterol/gamma-HCH transport system ATP-binding protein